MINLEGNVITFLWVLFLAGFSISQSAEACEQSETYFMAKQGGTFLNQGEYFTQQFELTQTCTLIFRFVSDYSADAVIFTSDQYNTFIEGGAVSGYGEFSDQIGTNTVTLNAGTYYLGVRNKVSSTNTYSYELDYPKAFSDAALIGNTTTTSQFVSAGSIFTQSFDIVDGTRTWIDGVNNDLEFYIIPELSLSNFQNNVSFDYYQDYFPGFSDSQPGGFEVALPAGSYYMAFYNPNSNDKPVAFTIEHYQINSTSGGETSVSNTADVSRDYISLIGNFSYSVNGSIVTINVDQLQNTSSTTTTGILHLQLFATADTTPISTGYTLADFSMATMDIQGSGQLAPTSSFTNFSATTVYTSPPIGTYNVYLIVSEYPDVHTVLASSPFDNQLVVSSSGSNATDSSSSNTSSLSDITAGATSVISLLLFCGVFMIRFFVCRGLKESD